MKGQLRIDEMYAFIMIDEDGTEGIPAIDGGGVLLPFVENTSRWSSFPHVRKLRLFPALEGAADGDATLEGVGQRALGRGSFVEVFADV